MLITARPFVTALILLLGVALACNFGGLAGGGQITPAETAAASTQAPAPAEPTEAPAATATAAPPTAQPTPPPASNFGENGAPTFAVGSWTGGEAEVRVSGSDTRTVTGLLRPESATADEVTTILLYGGGGDTINISIYGGGSDTTTEILPFYITVIQEHFDLEQVPGGPPCVVTYLEASDQRIEGTFRCESVEILIGPAPGPAVIEGSFTATR